MFKTNLAAATSPLADVIKPPMSRRSRRDGAWQLLPRLVFLEQLLHERLRADRSKTTVSLVLIEVDATFDLAHKPLSALLRTLHIHLRETDYVGVLEHNVLAVLLPDTGRAGAEKCMERAFARNASPITAATIATYPDQLFASLEPEVIVDEQENHALLVDTPESRAVQSVLKRLIDITGALVGMVVLSPVMLITAIAIKLTSPGPVIFKQIRIGKNFTPFTFYKFRSMYAGADDSVHRSYLEKLIKGDTAEPNPVSADKPLYKITSDARVTPLGRIIRKTSIDELPQLFNVLKGEMSLVGPRPPIPYETQNYQPWHLRRILEVKPGLTGIWQVEGRSRTTFDEMVRMDLKYSREWSVLLDLKLILRTFRVVVECKGAV